MKKMIIGLVLGFLIGAFCRLSGVPAPAPPLLQGALLVVAMTSGYLLADRVARKRATTRHLCGGPTGATLSHPNE